VLVDHLSKDFSEFLSGEAQNLTLACELKLHLPQVVHESVFQVGDITPFQAQIVYDIT
jgi:hypothetical protein